MVEVIFQKVVFGEVGDVAGLDGGEEVDVRGVGGEGDDVDHFYSVFSRAAQFAAGLDGWWSAWIFKRSGRCIEANWDCLAFWPNGNGLEMAAEIEWWKSDDDDCLPQELEIMWLERAKPYSVSRFICLM
jgi:hypothetical protein